MKKIMKYTLSGILLMAGLCVPVVGITFGEVYLKKQEQIKGENQPTEYMLHPQYVRDLKIIYHREYERLDKLMDASLISREDRQAEMTWIRQREKELIHEWELAGKPKDVVPSQGLFRRYNLVHADTPNGSVSSLGVFQPILE